MRLTALYDQQGSIVAAALHEAGENGPRPVPTRGLHVHEFEIPESHRSLRLDEMCRGLRVDVSSKRLLDCS
jgi:hypothetical protein